MKATELNPNHLGQTITAQIGKATVKDVLIGIDSSADLIRNGLFMGQEDLVIGRRNITLHFAAVGEVKVSDVTEVTIHE